MKTDEEKLNIAWSEIESAVHSKDIKRIMRLAFWIKRLISKTTIQVAIVAVLLAGGFMVHSVFAYSEYLDGTVFRESNVTSCGNCLVFQFSDPVFLIDLTFASQADARTIDAVNFSVTCQAYGDTHYFPVFAGKIPAYQLCGTLYISDLQGEDGVSVSYRYLPVIGDEGEPLNREELVFFGTCPEETNCYPSLRRPLATTADLTFGVAIVVVLLFLVLVAMIFNKIFKR